MKNIELQKQLCQFGLNPQDWVVQQITTRGYAVKNRQDLETYFWGKVTSGSKTSVKWKKLQIAI